MNKLLSNNLSFIFQSYFLNLLLDTIIQNNCNILQVKVFHYI